MIKPGDILVNDNAIRGGTEFRFFLVKNRTPKGRFRIHWLDREFVDDHPSNIVNEFFSERVVKVKYIDGKPIVNNIFSPFLLEQDQEELDCLSYTLNGNKYVYRKYDPNQTYIEHYYRLE